MHFRRIGLVVLLISLAGCQPASMAPHFGLAALPSVSTIGAADGAPAISASAGGQVTVSFESLLPAKARQLLATLADVDHVVVKLTPASGAAQQQTVNKASITSGQATATFTGVAPGQATFAVTVFNAGGQIIGLGSGTTAVVVGQTTTVDAAIQLNHTLAPPLPTSAPGGGGATTGNLSGNVSLIDGQTIQPLVLDASLAADQGAVMYQVLPGGDGTFWATEDSGSGGVIHFDRSGNLLARYLDQVFLLGDLAFDPAGNVVVKTEGLDNGDQERLYRITPGGVVSSPATFSAGPGVDYNVATSGTGDAWVWGSNGTQPSGLAKVDATGHLQQITSNVFYDDVLADSRGGILALTNGTSSMISRYAADGTVSWQHASGDLIDRPFGMGTDAAGNTWLVEPAVEIGQAERLVKLDPNGQLVGTYALPAGLGSSRRMTLDTGESARILCDASGNAYVLYNNNGASNADIVKVSANGQVAGISYPAEIRHTVMTWSMVGATAGNQELLLVEYEGATPKGAEYLYRLP